MWIHLWSQLLLHFIPPFKEYLFNTHSGPDTAQNAEDTMYLGLAWRQWFIVSSCHQFLRLFFSPCLSTGICCVTYAVFYLPDCAMHFAQLPPHPHNSSIVEGIITSPFYRWRNWLREITWSSARSWKEQNWQVNRDLTGLKARGLRPSSCTASSNYAAFSRPLKGCKEGMARTTVQFVFDTSLEFLVWFFKKRRKVFE